MTSDNNTLTLSSTTLVTSILLVTAFALFLTISGGAAAQDTKTIEPDTTHAALSSTGIDSPIQYSHNNESQVYGSKTFRVLDSTLNESHVAAGSSVRLEIVLANTGASPTPSTTLSPVVSPSTGYTASPTSYTVTLQPGEQLRYEYKFKFEQPGNYTITIPGTSIKKNVTVLNKTATVYSGNIQTAVKKQSIAKVITSYKDEVEISTHPSYNPNIPPVVQTSNGEFTNNAQGIIYDFGDAQEVRDGESLTLEGNTTSNSLKVGLAFENVPKQSHYTIQLNYEIEGSTNVQMKVVTRGGEVIDNNSKYMLGAGDPRKTKYFALTKEESEYIKNHKNIYLVFTADGTPKVDIFYAKAISSNYILDTTSARTTVTGFSVTNMSGGSETNFSIYEPIFIDITKTNKGTKTVERNVVLERNGQAVASKSVRLNPGESKTVTFIKYKPTGVYTYSARGGRYAKTVIVGNPMTNTNRAPVPKISSNTSQILNRYVPTGSNVGDDSTTEFELNASQSYDPNGDSITYEWQVEGATVATGPTLDDSHFTTNGTYDVTLIVEDEHGNRSATRTKVAINDIKPTALFQIEPTPIPNGTTAQFNASAALDQDGAIQRYIWSIDGTQIANETDPYTSYKFDSTGMYDVQLTTVDDDGNTKTRTYTVEVFNADVYASYNYTPSDPSTITEIQFDASGSSATNATIESYEWYRGDGTYLGNGEQFSKSFNETGDIQVKLRVEASNGKTANITKTIQIDPPFNATANADPETGAPGDTFYFDAYSTEDPQGIIDSYSWTLGDGTTASGQEVFHEYSEPGNYTVTLTVSGNGFQDSDTVTVQVKTDEPVAEAEFNTTVYLGDTVTLYGDNSYHPSGYISSYSWALGDGTTRSTTNVKEYEYNHPTTNYKEERLTQPYNATLTVTDEYGNTDTDYVHIEVQNRGPVSNFTVNDTADSPWTYYIYEGETIKLNASSSYHKEAPEAHITSKTWAMNGSNFSTQNTITRTHNKPGNYTYTLITEDNYSARDTQSAKIIVYDKPHAEFKTNVTQPYTKQKIEFNATPSTSGGGSSTTITEYRWDFKNDGTIDKITTDPTVVHSYDNDGNHTARLEVENSDGRTDNYTQVIEVLQGNTLTVNYTIQNPTSQSASNYQVDIIVNRRTEMDSDYGSIRFYQNGQQLDYHRVWYNNDQAKFVVELKTMPTDAAYVTMKYGADKLSTASNPEATYVAWDYHGNGRDEGTLYGTAQDMGSYVRLTEDIDGQQGSLRYGTFNMQVGLKATYDWRVHGGTGADSVNFVTYNDGSRYEHEDPNGHGIHFAVNDHDSCVGVNYDAQCDISTGYNKDTYWHQATASVSHDGGNYYTYYFDSNANGAAILDGRMYASGVGDRFGFSGRTGGLNNNHDVRDITIRKWLGQPMDVYVGQAPFYNQDFESGGIDGWDTETEEERNLNGWVTSSCDSGIQTNYYTKNIQDRYVETLTYDMYLAAVDSWDDEILRFQYRTADGNWHTVRSTTPHYQSGDENTEYDCQTGWNDVEYSWSGSTTVNAEITHIRIYGGIQQNDYDEAIAIDRVRLTAEGQTKWSESFETYNTGTRPWYVKVDGSNDDIWVSNNIASDGSQSLRSYQPDTGAPSHFHTWKDFGGISGAKEVAYEADIYIAGKNNGGTADAFTFGLLNTSHTDQSHKRAFGINFVRDGSYISTQGTNLRTDIRSSWVHVKVVVDYQSHDYTVYINGNYEGTFNMPNGGHAGEYRYIVHRNDNYDGYIDNIQINKVA